MIVIRDAKKFYFDFDQPKYVDENLKHKTELIINLTMNLQLKITNISMETIFINTKNSKTNEPHQFVLNLSQRLDLTQPARNVPGTSPEGSLKVVMSGTSRGPLRNSQETNKNIDDLMKKVFFRRNSLCFTHLSLILFGNKYSKVLNGDVHGTSTGPSCGTSRGPNDGTFWGRPRDVGHIRFLNSTQKN